MNEQSDESKLLNELGGKAYGLRLLTTMGYQVPNYFVVPSDKSTNGSDLLRQLKDFAMKHTRAAVRSSGNIEDGRQTSFAGVFESYLDVPVEEILSKIEAVRDSAQTARVKDYCQAMGLPAVDIKMHVIVQAFDEPSRSGVWMGSGGLGGRLEWNDGRGDKIVNGQVTPNFETYDENGHLSGQNAKELLVDQSGLFVADVCKEIQSKLGYDADLELCITSEGIRWLQLRRVTQKIDARKSTEASVVLKNVIKGEAASPYTASGTAYRLDQRHGDQWASNQILIARATSPNDMMYIMTSAGVVTKMGGMLSHSAVVCRELGKACVVGVDIEKIQHGDKIVINGKIGEVVLP